MRGILHLAWRYLAAHPVKTGILTLSVTLILYLPFGLRVLVRQGERELTARAADTPLLVGKKGSPLELVLSSLYFSSDVPELMEFGQAARIRDTGLARAIPLYVRFRAGDAPVVGTSLDYLDYRGLTPAEGRPFAVLGECVLGAGLARARGLGAGDHILSSPESVFDLAGVYPLRMRVAGVLDRTGGPDDDAVFCDVRTAWVIQGLAHGHEDLSDPGAAPRVLERRGNVFVGNASVLEFNEITPENIGSFHFHGDPATFPLTAVIALPKDAKAGTLLRGRYLGPGEAHQILRPRDVVSELLGTVLTVQGFVTAALGIVAAATLAVMALVFALSVRLRRREIETMVKIGGSRAVVGGVLVAEIAGVLVTGAALALLLLAVTAAWGPQLVRAVVR